MTDLSPDRLLQLWKKFDRNGDGTLDVKEMKQLMNVLAYEEGLEVPLPDSFVQMAMKELDISGDGVEKEEFINLFNNIWRKREKYSKKKVLAGPALGNLKPAQIRMLFQAFAKKEPGWILFDEFSRLVGILQEKDNREPIRESKVKAIFQKMDEDSLGKLSLKVFVDRFDVYWRNRGKQRALADTRGTKKTLHEDHMAALWRKFDVDGDGRLTLEEFSDLLNGLQRLEGRHDLPLAIVKSIFQRIDSDGGGTIDEDEFRNNIHIYWENREKINEQAALLDGRGEFGGSLIHMDSNPLGKKKGLNMRKDEEVLDYMVRSKRNLNAADDDQEAKPNSEADTKRRLRNNHRIRLGPQYPRGFLKEDKPLTEDQLEKLFHRMGGITDAAMEGGGVLGVEDLRGSIDASARRDGYNDGRVDPAFISWLTHSLNGNKWRGPFQPPADVTKIGFMTRWNALFWTRRTYEVPLGADPTQETRYGNGFDEFMAKDRADPQGAVFEEQLRKERIRKDHLQTLRSEIPNTVLTPSNTIDLAKVKLIHDPKLNQLARLYAEENLDDEVGELSDEFLRKAWDVADQDKSGDLNYVELRTLLQALNRKEGKSEVLADGYVRKVFALLDPDNDQKITWPEFHQHFPFFWRNRGEFDSMKITFMTEPQLAKIWERYDEDGNGYLDRAEFEMMIRKIFQRERKPLTPDKMREAWRVFDPLGSGQILWPAFHQGFNSFWGAHVMNASIVSKDADVVQSRPPLTQPELSAAFRVADRDEDGMLNRQEVRLLMEHVREKHSWMILISDASVQVVKRLLQPEAYMEVDKSEFFKKFNSQVYLNKDIFAMAKKAEELAPAPPLSEVEIGRQFRAYETEHMDSMSYESFANLIDAMWAQAGYEPGAYDPEMVWEMFWEIDEDGDGHLHWSEFKKGYQQVWRTRLRRFDMEMRGKEAALSKQDLDIMFRTADRDADGYLRRFELEFMLEQIRIDWKYSAKLTPGFVSRFIREIDPDGLGAIDRDMFLSKFNRFWCRQKQRLEAHETVALMYGASKMMSGGVGGGTDIHEETAVKSPKDFIVLNKAVLPSFACQEQVNNVLLKARSVMRGSTRDPDGPRFMGSAALIPGWPASGGPPPVSNSTSLGGMGSLGRPGFPHAPPIPTKGMSGLYSFPLLSHEAQGPLENEAAMRVYPAASVGRGGEGFWAGPGGVAAFPYGW